MIVLAATEGDGAERQPAGAYNAAVDLIDRNLAAGRQRKTVFIDEAGRYSYGDLAERVDRFANAIRTLGVEPEQRIVLALLDTIDFPTCFLGAIKAGVVPIPTNTLFQAADFAHILSDSRARALVVSDVLLPKLVEAARIADWDGLVIVSGAALGDRLALPTLMARAGSVATAASTRADDTCFWLYSSGSTGQPKGTVHIQTSLIETARLFGQGVLGIGEGDLVYSAAKLFFAYGLGNALTFTMAVGATSILVSGRPTADTVNEVLRRERPTLFCGVPTLYGALLACPRVPAPGEHGLRLCTSAGEALPVEVGRAWTARTGVEIVDGIGSTEMLHIFVSNRPGAVRYGVTGKPVPGYRARLVDENRREVAPGDIGEMEVSGPTAATQYWNNPDKTRATFLGEWVRTGDKFRQDDEGDYIHCGRADDMLKVGGIWVSPMEVESALLGHPAIQEAAVIGLADAHGLIKPKAFVVLKPGVPQDAELTQVLQDHVKSRLAPYKYPRWIEFVDDLPKTATGKIQRHVLRHREAEAAQPMGAVDQ
ncbi:MAG TPA: benzoate-CoA ligase family protein [Aliidongia sp.]|uniref:benzoate-CoA ligase family protein n=1 Tax=Aliidongia sp. TaxID=1914230 RepID=UPI002DDD432B|nr:benzoate-CoA ligase family protein [Aliidongia sp.]HEV2674797.1 benzoate-CoA ligase family protein [Aliidongia sp.]